jgi:filamentous hemagglutinin
MTQTNLEKYGIAQRDGTSFIMPGHEATELLAKTAGDKLALEQALG